MNTEFLLSPLRESDVFETACRKLGEPGKRAALFSLSGAQKAHAACAAALETGRPLVVLCDSERAAGRTAEDYASLLDGKVALFPARDLTFYQDVAASHDVSSRRIEALSRALGGDLHAVVMPVDALLHRVMPKQVFCECSIALHTGDTVSGSELEKRLLASGYTREHMVEGKGQFSVRGEIVDIYPADAAAAIRLDFFDDELESIRTLDVLSQRSTGEMDSILIPPACEAPVPLSAEAQRLA